ncbi:DUF1064 domain-containing protein [Campylobacter pinnipediorum]|uniref:DUF1064 domain protein n=1 Tax=Campylobacter pinnipediorum subsp. pinnipediorum TaxID=1660067 RepID=A0AAX0L9R0_9BACT|nr:DUF1064 domain-containing protein [Campylobacter pinnipediorum]AQW83005.1 putative DUF1064 domain protein [Campylobacter pinnipediorum subsp. pinnipediorum]OPA77345.1 hypothetical protein BFG04_04425 [Campylobacter pinnipediorum subsp. pinnipediorum]
MRFNKYHNTKSKGYDSKKEAKRANELRLLQSAKQISELKEQVSFVLQESFRVPSDKTKNGYETVRDIKYIADFTYFKNGVMFIEDVKGFKTTEYKLKAKMLKKLIADKKINAVFVES